jgi:hypothetical protein
LAWAVAGFVAWRRSGDDRADWRFCLAATAVFFVAMTGYPNWHGGWSLGNRYLLPLLFFVGCAIPYALASPLSRWLFAAAAGFSVLTHAVLTSTWVHHPADFLWPISNAAVWFLVRGFVSEGAFGDSSAWSWVAPVMSILVCGAAFVGSLPGLVISPGRKVAAAGFAVVLFAFFAVAPPDLDYPARLLRAQIYSVNSGRDPSRSELLRTVQSASTPAERSLAMRFWQRYGARRR